MSKTIYELTVSVQTCTSVDITECYSSKEALQEAIYQFFMCMCDEKLTPWQLLKDCIKDNSGFTDEYNEKRLGEMGAFEQRDDIRGALEELGREDLEELSTMLRQIGVEEIRVLEMFDLEDARRRLPGMPPEP